MTTEGGEVILSTPPRGTHAPQSIIYGTPTGANTPSVILLIELILKAMRGLWLSPLNPKGDYMLSIAELFASCR